MFSRYPPPLIPFDFILIPTPCDKKPFEIFFNPIYFSPFFVEISYNAKNENELIFFSLQI